MRNKNIYLILISLLLFINSKAQAPINANVILVHNIIFKDAVNRLLDSGFTIKKIDSNYNTIETDPKAWNRSGWGQQMLLKIRIKDSIAEITGLMGFEENNNNKYSPGSLGAILSGVNTPISNVKAFQKRKKPTPFTIMNNIALSFNKPVEYEIIK
jgi:hypothetical protein